MSEMNPRERLLALYERVAQLRAFREAEDAQMTAEERAESDAVIAELLHAASKLKQQFRLEILTEEFAQTLGRMVAYQKDAELYALTRDIEAAEEALRKAHEMSVLCGLMIGEITGNGGDHAS